MTEFLLLLSLWPFHHKKPEKHHQDTVCMMDNNGHCDYMLKFTPPNVRMGKAHYDSPDGTCKAGYHIIFPSNVCGRNDLNVYSGGSL